MGAHANTPAMAVTFRLREVLVKKGISQTEASRITRVSFATINRLCTNATRQISLDVIDALCSSLRITPGQLFSQDDADEAPVPDARRKQKRGRS